MASGRTDNIKTYTARDVSEVSGICSDILSSEDINDSNCDCQFAIHLALEEAIFNAVHHGNSNDSSKRAVVEFKVEDGLATFTITDNGPGFDPDSLPDPTADENLLKSGGRGVLLMRSYMDSVKFNTTGNQVTMSKKLVK